MFTSREISVERQVWLIDPVQPPERRGRTGGEDLFFLDVGNFGELAHLLELILAQLGCKRVHEWAVEGRLRTCQGESRKHRVRTPTRNFLLFEDHDEPL